MIPTQGSDGFAAPANRALRWRTRLSRFVMIAVAAATLTGCSAFRGLDDYIAYNDDSNDFIVGTRDSMKAQKAWILRLHSYMGEPHLFTFGEGFRAGYLDVASGGQGCPPAVPPRKYWSWMYQTRKGQEKVSAWFSGFPYGAMAAEEDGAGNYKSIQVSYPIKIQYSPEFQAGQMNAADGSLYLDMEVEMYDPAMDGGIPPVPEAVPYSDSAPSYPDPHQTSLDSQSRPVEMPAAVQPPQNWWNEPGAIPSADAVIEQNGT